MMFRGKDIDERTYEIEGHFLGVGGGSTGTVQ